MRSSCRRNLRLLVAIPRGAPLRRLRLPTWRVGVPHRAEGRGRLTSLARAALGDLARGAQLVRRHLKPRGHQACEGSALRHGTSTCRLSGHPGRRAGGARCRVRPWPGRQSGWRANACPAEARRRHCDEQLAGLSRHGRHCLEAGRCPRAAPCQAHPASPSSRVAGGRAPCDGARLLGSQCTLQKDLASRAHARAKTKMFNRMQVVWLRDWGGEWCRDTHAVGAKVHGTLEITTRAHRARAPGRTRTSRSLRPLRIASRLGRGIRRHDRIARVLLFARFAAPCIHGCG